MKFRLTLLFLCAIFMSSMSTPASGASSCMRIHSTGFCHVKQDRHAIKVFRKRILNEARRTGVHVKLKPVRKLSWNPTRIHRTNKWYRLLFKKLFAMPTSWPSPQSYAAWTAQQKYGWQHDQFQCLDTLWGVRESGWQVNNVNSSSGASGIPQRLGNGSLPANWYDPTGIPQVNWGLQYISGRYGTPCAALAHSYSYNWY